MHHGKDLGEIFLKMYGFAMLRTAGQKLHEIFQSVHYFVVFIIYVSTGSSSINTVTVWPRSPAGVNPTMLFVHAICARHLRGARIFFSKPLPIGLEMG